MATAITACAGQQGSALTGTTTTPEAQARWDAIRDRQAQSARVTELVARGDLDALDAILAANLSSTDPTVRYTARRNLATAAQIAGRWDRVETELTEALALLPKLKRDQPTLNQHRATMLITRADAAERGPRDHERALTLYDDALAVVGGLTLETRASTVNHTARLMATIGRRDQAVARLDAMLSSPDGAALAKPQVIQLWITTIEILEQADPLHSTGEYAKAFARREALLTRYPEIDTPPLMHNALAVARQMFRAQQQPAQAALFSRIAVALDRAQQDLAANPPADIRAAASRQQELDTLVQQLNVARQDAALARR